MVQWFAAKRPGVVFHPYPITPFHADYIHHADIAEAAIAAAGAASSGVSGGGAGVAVAEVPALDGAVGGWFTPPWAKQGWHQAYRVLAPSLDAPARRAADEIYQSLVRGAADGLVEQIRLERRLIAALTAGCLFAAAGVCQRGDIGGRREHGVRLAGGPRNAGTCPHREAEGFSLERQFAPRRWRAAHCGLESRRRIQRRRRPADLVRDGRSGDVADTLQRRMDPQPRASRSRDAAW
jgi:hypothetical protein